MPMKIKTSRRSFFTSYVTGTIILILLLILLPLASLPVWFIYVSMVLIIIFFLESEIAIIYRTYIIESDKVSEIQGFISKKRIAIPSSKIANTVLKKGIIGRIFRFGDIIITGFAEDDKIILRGIFHPEKILETIEENIG